MSDDTPQKRGRAWEPVFAKSIGGSPIKMSGAGFTKLDVRGMSIMWSLKATDAGSIRLEDAWMREALAAINAPGGIGGMMIPGLALKTAGYEYMVFRKDDAMMLMTSDQHSVATPSSYGVVDLSRRLPDFLKDS